MELEDLLDPSLLPSSPTRVSLVSTATPRSLVSVFGHVVRLAADLSFSLGGWINHNYEQLGWQLAGSVATVAYTAVMTYIILFIVDHIPGLKLRSSEESEILGIDETEVRHSFNLVPTDYG